ncbi:hypothetical protein ABIE65_001197 [Constrictibacter sp. MBR-5]|jgi:hypothetical protein|uniref:hypothetical protein n=1 Tax=Constrictibacter sp. MBR-5 TaxID=3156467 RepID=UPI0033964189
MDDALPGATAFAMPDVPFIDAGAGGAPAVFDAAPDRAIRLLEWGERKYGLAAMRMADRRSRGWLIRAGNPYVAEIDAIAARIGRPGAFMLNLSFEWNCTAAVGPDPERGGARLLRTLDWPLPGLGENLVVVRHEGPHGSWLSATWPGFVGSLTIMAPGRFAVSINQPPARLTKIGPFGVPRVVDWFISRRKVARSNGLPPAHLLRKVCEEAADYAEAKRMLSDAAVCIPVFFTVAGLAPTEGCLIERMETRAFTFEAPVCAANHWLTPGQYGRMRTATSPQRLDSLRARMETAVEMEWLVEPVLNHATRLAAVANPGAGHLVVQGFEAGGAVTVPTQFVA